MMHFRKHTIALSSIIVTVGIVFFLTQSFAVTAQSNPTEITISDEVEQPNVKDFGINIGSVDQFGAAQILKNPVINPGFEPGEFAMIVLAKEGSTGEQIIQDNWESSWTSQFAGQPDGFWNGARFEILSGPAKGREGTVSNFSLSGFNPVFTLDGNGPAPEAQDAVMFSMNVPGFFVNSANPDLWEIDTTQTRPDSPGTQSLKLIPGDPYWQASYLYVMDSYSRDADYTAGKLFQVEGNWKFSVWAKGATADAELTALLRREDGPFFMLETFPVGTEWTLIESEFFAPVGMDDLDERNRNGKTPALEFAFNTGQAGVEIWVDDVVLERTDYQNPSTFSDKFVGVLKELDPGILRNWGDQLGSSLDNQLAVPHARKTTEFSPHKFNPRSYHFSIHDFLELALEVGAEPWYVIPPTFTAAEYENLMGYLAAPAGSHPYADLRASLGQTEPWTTVFPTIHLEYGNEMWGSNAGGDQFIGATVRSGIRLGQMGHERIGRMKASPFYAPDKFNFVIGGQMFLPFRQFEIESNSQTHDSVALAPYYGELEVITSTAEIYYPMFARAVQDVRNTEEGLFASQLQLDRADPDNNNLAIYEINLHTTRGDAPEALRNEFLTGINSGLALPLYMMTFQRDLGIVDQNAFQAIQFSNQLQSGEYARIWGLMRDLEATGRKRPTWLGLEMANTAVRGNMLKTSVRGPYNRKTVPPINGLIEEVQLQTIQAFAYQDGDSYAVALFNLDQDQPQSVQLTLPRPPDGTARMHTLTAVDADDNNEDGVRIVIKKESRVDFAQGYGLELAPASMVVLEWGIPGNPQPFVKATSTPFPAVTPTLTPTPTETPLPTATATATPLPTATPVPSFIEGTFGTANGPRGPILSMLIFSLGLLMMIGAAIVFISARKK